MFRENLSAAAALLVTRQASGATVMDFSEFSVLVEDATRNAPLAPLTDLFGRCKVTLQENPLFWLRLVAYGYACVHLVRHHGSSLGFSSLTTYSVQQLLRGAPDPYIRKRIEEFPGAFDALIARGL